MALVGKLEKDIEIKAPADKFYEIFSCKPHHISNVCPERVQGVQLHEGDWGATDAVVHWNYVLDGKEHTAKEIIELIDDEKKLVIYKLIEGDLMKEYKSFKFIVQVVPKGEGSLVKWIMEYEKLSDDIAHPEKMMELATNVTRDIEEHLISA